ncbi:hypothetical protein BW723_17265 [Polaribacter reichenbachii]|uniref:DUF1963 domain-containing protein n=1 Tax=Polaribacter reichenbachii TaxID=996801 RepID=A0A1B8U483_9FLAO|nr:DUF1963 domain-containing protein [Polaribacter reichenbachii]APZ47937.1 hypothetical protein BW723_17265 [Polaribacter reichenbachii]AUC18569.1 hypothetical protein BTO17_07660 [Polaribacter reichenbachii]OBY66639.1 hypothetical protein LPB301_06485 [Polaribacter reichenbachii]
MIPKFLKKYEEALKKYEREFVKINAKPIKCELLKDSLSIRESKFLGKPFLPLDKEYPKDKKGNPMIMIAQLNFEEIPNLENFPKEGLLQLFLSPFDWYEEGFKIFFHSKKDLEKEHLTDFSFLNESYYEESPVFKIHKLTFEKSIDKGNSEDLQFDFSFDGLPYWEFEDTLAEVERNDLFDFFTCESHKIGGYADFTQSDPRDCEGNNVDDIQLLQIDSEDDIMFGDSGLGHIFINKKSLLEKDFSKAYFYWDCC